MILFLALAFRFFTSAFSRLWPLMDELNLTLAV
jgi:hypothetical protein